MDRFEMELMAETSMQIMVASADRDSETVARLMTEVGCRENGAIAVYSLCCSWAEVIMRVTLGRTERGGEDLAVMGVAAVGPDGIRHLAPEDAPPQVRPMIWATRFVAAYANGDNDTTLALFTTSLDRGEAHIGDVVALVGMVGDALLDAEPGALS